MIGERPSLASWLLSSSEAAGIDAFVAQYATDATFYGSGKAALRDGLANLVEPGEAVLLPAYLPDAVAEPIYDLGLEPRYYRLEPTLAPNLADLERRLDDRTAAVMTVDYFGFPQPGLEAVATIVDGYDCYHVDDSAHSPLSVDDGTLLGTRGDFGFTSLRKLLPIPDGAMLYCTDEAVAERFEPSSIAGVRDTPAVDDCRYVLRSLLADTLAVNDTVRRTIDGLVTARVGSIDEPSVRYEASKTKMSALSASVVSAADPHAIREARRRNYLAWNRVFDDHPEVEPLYDSLSTGICPQVFPARTSAPQRLLAVLRRCGVDGAHTWPRLPGTVRDDPAYDVARRLARELVVCPVHQGIEPMAIDAVGARLQR